METKEPQQNLGKNKSLFTFKQRSKLETKEPQQDLRKNKSLFTIFMWFENSEAPNGLVRKHLDTLQL